VGLQREDIPALPTGDGGATLNLIAGELGAAKGPVETLSGHFMSTVELTPGARASLRAPAGRNVFFYVVRGAVRVGGAEVPQWRLVEFNDDGDEITLEAGNDPAFILFGHGEPINEP